MSGEEDDPMGAASGEAAGFDMALHYTKYLSRQARRLHVVVSVTARDLAVEARPDRPDPPSAEVVLVDTSGSMEYPPEKMRAARRATETAIDTVPDGAFFAVVGGNHLARMVYPDEPRLIEASARSKASAVDAVGRLIGVGGTAMGSWLALANTLFDAHPWGLRHGLLFTDGKNEHESRAELDRVLAACNGRFTCDARGIGDGWQEEELHRIVSVLNGRSDAVRDYGDLAGDLRDAIRAAGRRTVPDVTLRVATRTGTRLRHARQVYPTDAEVLGRPTDRGENVTDHYVGSWAQERRDYQIVLDVEPTDRPMDLDTLAGTVELLLGRPGASLAPPVAGPELILLQWTSDPMRYTEFNDVVAHYAGQQELGEAIRGGCAAMRLQDDATAVEQLGRAVALAHACENREALDRLAALVEIVDPVAGEVRLRRDSRLVDRLWSESGSRVTHLWSGPDGSDGSDGLREMRRQVVGSTDDPAAAELVCPGCGLEWPAGYRRCERCNAPLGAGAAS
jgi:hypothetical protein